MNQAHDTWMASKHGPILSDINSCTACHAKEGAFGYIKAKVAGFASVFYHVLGLLSGESLEVEKGTKPVYCLKSGCHTINDLDNDYKVWVNHPFHVNKGFKCESCHDRIAHGWDEDIQSVPSMQDTCFNCHDDKTASHDNCGLCHVYQEGMLKGSGGFGIPENPSPHGEGLSCRDCHTHACATDHETCYSCHDSDIVDEIATQQTEVSKKLEKIKKTLNQLDRILKQYENYGLLTQEDYTLFQMVKKNYEFIEKDLSRGVHNYYYTKEMLSFCDERADAIIAGIRTKLTSK